MGMVRLFLGLLKGAALGGGLGYGAHHLGLGTSLGLLLYGAVGFVVGLLGGRPFWSHMLDKDSTIVTAVLKAVVGFGVGVGLYEVVLHVGGDPSLSFGGEHRPLSTWPYVLGALVGAVYGAWVEIDDAPAKAAPPKQTER
jgi:hypothetical protein